jgi:DNA transformation protein and related proteins
LRLITFAGQERIGGKPIRGGGGGAMAASKSFSEFLREQLAPLGPLSFRRMFGKTGVFCEGVMFAVVADDTLYFRIDETNKPIFQEAAAFPPLNYTKAGRTIDLAFWRTPERLFDEPEELVAWSRAALATAHRVAIQRAPDVSAKLTRQARANSAGKRLKSKV